MAGARGDEGAPERSPGIDTATLGWRRVPFVRHDEERDIETSSDNARKVHAINPRGSIPTFDIEGDVMVGFSEEMFGATMQRAAQRQAARRQL